MNERTFNQRYFKCICLKWRFLWRLYTERYPARVQALNMICNHACNLEARHHGCGCNTSPIRQQAGIGEGAIEIVGAEIIGHPSVCRFTDALNDELPPDTQ